MNHNTREILRALYCHCNPIDIDMDYLKDWDFSCESCPYSHADCTYNSLKDAIALIRKQREMLKRYKRLYYVTKARLERIEAYEQEEDFD